MVDIKLATYLGEMKTEMRNFMKQLLKKIKGCKMEEPKDSYKIGENLNNKGKTLMENELNGK